MFLFAGFDFKCLAVCNGRNGLYNLPKRSKCSPFMTGSRRLLQKNAAFMILLLFPVVIYMRTWITAPIAVAAPLILDCHWETHGLPTRSNILQFRVLQQAKG